jgi:hypothetical protein
VEEPHAVVRANTGLPDHARIARDQVELPGRELVPVQEIVALEPVLEQERRAVRPPVLDEDAAFELGREIRPLAAREIPDSAGRRRRAVVEREPLVAGDR